MKVKGKFAALEYRLKVHCHALSYILMSACWHSHNNNANMLTIRSLNVYKLSLSC